MKVKNSAWIILIAALFAVPSLAQSKIGADPSPPRPESQKGDPGIGVGSKIAVGLSGREENIMKTIGIDMKSGARSPAGDEGLDGTIWSNFPVTGWFFGTDPVLDCGIIPDPPTGLDDEVIDGFEFTYVTNNLDPSGEDISTYFFDSCTGWGNLGVQEAGFLFTGLPNAYTFGSLPPGRVWIVDVTVDLEGSGYEFLLGKEHGFMMDIVSTPTMGETGYTIGTSPAGAGKSLLARAYGGPQAPAWNMSYYGIDGRGNDACLYTYGAWAPGQHVGFLLRKNQMPLPGWLLLSLGRTNVYLPSLDVTLFVKPPFPAPPVPMIPDFAGDFDRVSLSIGPGLAGRRLYFQGAITDISPLAPLDLSNGVYSN